MKLLIDMNLSPEWIPFLIAKGFQAVHWSAIGKATASDIEILDYAGAHGYAVLTQDLDLGVILATTRANKPSVIQIRSDELHPNAIGKIVIAALNESQRDIEAGALITLDSKRSRLRMLPFPPAQQ